MRLRTAALLLALAAAGAGAFVLMPRNGVTQAPPNAVKPTPAPAHRLVAAPGLVEPAGEEREIGSEVIGMIREMRVEENDPVKTGDVIAVIENREQESRLAQARAELALRGAELERLINGARPEERQEARASVAEAEATLAQARREYDRRVPLAQTGAASASALDQARAAKETAEARLAALRARRALIEAPPRVEDVAAAKARVALALSQVAQAEAALDKTIIRSPIDGLVLRRLRVAGEAVGNQPPTGIAVVGDLSRLRVRAEVDELDLGRILVGQRVEVAADAIPAKRFGGAVARVAKRLGAKEVKTGRPKERADTKVLQVLIDLDPGVDLPVGLRVDVTFPEAQGS